MRFVFSTTIHSDYLKYVVFIEDTNTTSQIPFLVRRETVDSLLKFIELYEQGKKYISNRESNADANFIKLKSYGLVLRRFYSHAPLNPEVCIRSDEHIKTFLSMLKEQLLNNMCFYDRFEKKPITPQETKFEETKPDDETKPDEEIKPYTPAVYDFNVIAATNEVTFKFCERDNVHRIRARILDLVLLDIYIKDGSLFKSGVFDFKCVPSFVNEIKRLEVNTEDKYSFYMFVDTEAYNAFVAGISEFCKTQTIKVVY